MGEFNHHEPSLPRQEAEVAQLKRHGQPESTSPGATEVVVTNSDQPGDIPSVLEPSLAELAEALSRLADAKGAVPAGVASVLRRHNGWGGRLIDVLEVITENPETMGYLAGGRRADEVITWLQPWADSALSLEEIRLVIACGGWDPEPFVVIARAGLLKAFLFSPDGSPRRIRGELAGGWASDQLALSDDEEVLRQVRQFVEDAKVFQPTKPESKQSR